MKKLKNILSLLTLAEKKNFVLLFFLIFITTVFDALGVVSIFPFLAILANQNLVNSNPILKYFYEASDAFGVTNIVQFLFFIGILSFLFFIFSITIRVITLYAQNRYIYMREYSIGKRLIESYLYQNYLWLLNRHSSEMSNNILTQVSEVVRNSIYPFIYMLANSLLIIILTIIIFIIDPVVALSLGLILGLSYGIIFYFSKNILDRIGVISLDANKKRFSLVNEAFSNLKELKLRGLEQFYIKDFSKFTEIYASKQSLAASLGVIPRFLIEALAFGGMISVIIFLIYRGEDFSKTIPFLALFAFTGYRLLPALQMTYISFTQLRFSEAALNILNNDLNNLPSSKVVLSPVRNMTFEKSIRLDNISFSFPNQKIPTLNNINLSIPFFNMIGIIGATGSGKTTLVDLILGLIDPCKGTLSVDENIINDKNKKSWQNNIGYAPQQIYLSDVSIAANIAFGVDDKDIDYQAVEEAAKIACLHNFVSKKLPNGYNTIVGEKGSHLSGGERQRIGIARAFYNKPGIVVLDEATNALDKLTEQLIIENIDSLKYKKTLIIISHHLNCLKKCDTILLLEKGELKKNGKYEEIEKFYRGLK